MVVTCAFYGFINRTTKVTLQVDREDLEVGRSFAFEEDRYVILSVFEAQNDYRANVRPEHFQPFPTPARFKAPTPNTPAVAPTDALQSRKHGREAFLQARLQAAEARLEDVLRERDEALKRLDHAIEELDRLQQTAQP